ncbi:hypothetical protein GDO81_009002 [Engystomops pustulosus]|uniref:Uncharacterized protein n=1 Tax=Engystomops pustulosus TaxID=76066 RepID=A0AAV7BN17_ENGPU|nr:hypothetical protein GDO81_009002 [Engystomops pustulosus]
MSGIDRMSLYLQDLQDGDAVGGCLCIGSDFPLFFPSSSCLPHSPPCFCPHSLRHRSLNLDPSVGVHTSAGSQQRPSPRYSCTRLPSHPVSCASVLCVPSVSYHAQATQMVDQAAQAGATKC